MASYLDPVTRVSTEDPFASRMRRDFLESAFDLAATPTPIAQQQIAGFDPLQQQARQLASGLGQFQPFIQQAAGFYGPQGARDFYNPYEDAVVQQTISDLSERSGIQGIADRASAVQAGAFGGSRGRLMESERQRSFGRGLAEAIGGIRSRGFEGARAAAQGAASGLAGLAQTGQAGLINQIGTLGQLGQLGRGIQQAGFDATFDAAQRTALEPRQRLQTLQSMLRMLPTTRAETTYRAAAGTSPLAQALSLLQGGGLGGLLGMEEGGFVGAGGKEYPNKGLAALSKKAPDVVKKMGFERGGEFFPAEEAINFIEGTGPMGVPYPNGMPAQVFEQGDDEINAALNAMAATVKPTGETPSVPMEEPNIAPMLAEEEEGKTNSKAKEALLNVVDKRRTSIQNEIVDMIQDINIDEDAVSADQFVEKVLPEIVKLSSMFESQTEDMANRIGVELEEDEKTLLTNEFEMELQQKFPSLSKQVEQMEDMEGTGDVLRMQSGGGVPDFTKLPGLIKAISDGTKTIKEIADELGVTEEVLNNIYKRAGFRNENLEDTFNQNVEQNAVDPNFLYRTNILDQAKPYYENLQERAETVRRAALASGKTKQGGLAGLFDVKGQADIAAEKTAAAGDVAMLQAAGRGSITGSAAERDYLRGSPIALQEAFAGLAKNNSLDLAYKEFLNSGLPIPEAYDPQGIFNSSKKIDGKDITFGEFYRNKIAGSAIGKAVSLNDIISEWQKITETGK